MQEEIKTKSTGEPQIKVLFPEDTQEIGEIILSEGDVEQEDLSSVMEEMERDRELYSRGCAVLREGNIIDGKVIAVRGTDVMVDIGFKSEGIIPLEEFGDKTPQPGDEVSIFLEALEDENGQVVISKKRADFIRVWDIIKDAYETKKPLRGKIKKRIKGGMVVDLMGVDAFLPGSQIALRPVPDFDALINEEMDFRVIKLNKIRRNIVVSHRILLEEKRGKEREELLKTIEEGQVREGVVKNITDFGVFIDLGGMDGLLHITDMSWTRINHPSEMVKIGDTINVKILKYDREKQRISLGLKQLVPSPWDNVDERFPVNKRVKGKVVNLMKYGAFIQLDEGIEGLVHVSEMSWTKHISHPSEMLEVGQEVECVVLDVDKENHKISLGIKQLEPDPWKVAAEKYTPGARVTGVVRNLTAFGAFIEIEEGIEGLIHISDISWTKRVNHPSEFFRRGQKVEAVVLGIDSENHRISLGYKQLEEDPWPSMSKKYAVGAETEGRILHMTDRGVIVELPDGVEGFVPVTQLGKRVDKPQDAFNEGDILPLKVIEFEEKDHRIVLSVNAYFQSREKADLDRYLAAHPTKMMQMREMAKVTHLSGSTSAGEETAEALSEAAEEKTAEADSVPETEKIPSEESSVEENTSIEDNSAVSESGETVENAENADAVSDEMNDERQNAE
ncbi:30S ribosomal protein S1 [bacterium]|nr:30S ribosomal protein S1 [bacterium]